MDTYTAQHGRCHAVGYRLCLDFEGTYDKDYVASHTYGFESLLTMFSVKRMEFPRHQVGFTALRRAFKNHKSTGEGMGFQATSIAHYLGGGTIRGAYSTEPARLAVFLLAMQGLGRPGVHQFCHNMVFLAEPFAHQTMFSPQVAYRGTEVPFQASEIHGISGTILLSNGIRPAGTHRRFTNPNSH